MKHCKFCVMPDTRPGIKFDSTGVCLACRNHEKNKYVDWNKRMDELLNLCDEYRRADGYDCVIPVSGGKDSHFLTHVMTEMSMNPLLVCVADPFTHTETGKHNLRNISEAFSCNVLVHNIDISLFKRMTRKDFEETGEPLKYTEKLIYELPCYYAYNLELPLVMFGENSAYRYGTTDTDSPYVQNEAKVDARYMSYYVPWDDEHNRDIAKRYGFHDLSHEWKREGYIDDYGQIDSIAYMVHLWLKYPKFGFSRTSDIASRWVRKGVITRDNAIQLVKHHDHILDQRALEDFCKTLGYTEKQFWDITEKFWNRDIFEKIDGLWRLKELEW